MKIKLHLVPLFFIVFISIQAQTILEDNFEDYNDTEAVFAAGYSLDNKESYTDDVILTLEEESENKYAQLSR